MPWRIENEADLVRDIVFVLPRIPGAMPRYKRDMTEHWAEIMARAIVAHLRLANWRIKRGPPAPNHSTPPMRQGEAMNRLLYAATVAVAIIVSAVGAHAWTLFTTDKVAPAPQAVPAPPAVPPTGRYVLYLSPLNARDVFMLDTVTGNVWQRTTFTDVAGQPTVWDYMDRIDNFDQLRAFITARGPIQPTRKMK